jgi:transcriptional regulator with XRE-family HTH domain
MSGTNLGSIIRRIRVGKGFSQEYMAISLGISQKTCSRIEQGGGALNVERLRLMAKILEISMQELISLWECTSDVSLTISQLTQGNYLKDKINCSPSNCPYKERIREMHYEIEEFKKKETSNF